MLNFLNKKSNWSNWKPITIYTCDFNDFILLGKINLTNGDLKFKSIKVGGKIDSQRFTHAHNLFDKPLDANKQLLELINL